MLFLRIVRYKLKIAKTNVDFFYFYLTILTFVLAIVSLSHIKLA